MVSRTGVLIIYHRTCAGGRYVQDQHFSDDTSPLHFCRRICNNHDATRNGGRKLVRTYFQAADVVIPQTPFRMHEISLSYVFEQSIAWDRCGDSGDKGHDGGLSKENVKSNSNVIINPYRNNAKGGRVEHAATVRNPYKTACSRNKEDFTQQQCMLSNTKVSSNIQEHTSLFCEPMLTHPKDTHVYFRGYQYRIAP